jgi:hypothetical protein
MPAVYSVTTGTSTVAVGAPGGTEFDGSHEVGEQREVPPPIAEAAATWLTDH